MNDNSLNLLIDEDELKESDQITLYKEFIRILEKDIDDAKSRNSREGWNTWGILGAIVASVILLLGQTKDLQEIPQETKMICITFILLFQWIFGAYNVFTGNRSFVKERRLIDSKQIYKGKRFLFLIRFLILLAVSFGIYTSDYSLWIKVTSITLILVPILYMILALFLGAYTQIFIGNTPKNQKVNSISAYSILMFYLMAIILLGYELKFPMGKSLSAAYAIGFSLCAIVILIEVLLSNSTSTDEIADLQDLKDDIIFRRTFLNEALNRYQILKEGKSLFDEMKIDLDRIMGYLHREEEIYIEQRKIVKKLTELISSKPHSQEMLEDKNEQASIHSKSFETYSREMNSLTSLVKSEFDPFYKKLKKAADASGDYETEDLIKKLLNQKLSDLVEKENEINIERTNLSEQANRLKLQDSESRKENE